MKKILLTSTSFQDTPGAHHAALAALPVEVDRKRGPLSETDMLELAPLYDGLLCGDDELTANVLEKGFAGRLRFISKYGVGLDKIDLIAAKKLGIPVTNCPGVNQNAVAEHVLGLLISFYRNIHLSYNDTKAGGWKRMTGREIAGKTLGIAGLGAIGKELAKKASALGMHVIAFDVAYDEEIVALYKISKAATLEALFSEADVVSLHMPFNVHTHEIVNKALLEKSKPGLVLINTARGKLIDETAVLDAVEKSILAGYLADVMTEEPLDPNNRLKDHPNVLITPHIGSRTYDSVVKQGSMAVENLKKLLK